MKIPTMPACALALLGASACGDDDFSGPNMPGELGRGAFLYICVGDSDPYCEGATPSSFPEAIAVGATFDLEYEADDDADDPPLPQVLPSSSRSVASVQMAFQILRPGYAAFLAANAESEVYDLRHLYAADVARIAFSSADSEDLADVTLAPGDTLTLTATPQDFARTTLGGSLTYTWSSDAAEVVRIASADVDRDVTIEALAVGNTTVRIDAGGVVQTLVVYVEGEPTAGSSDSSDSAESSDSGETSGSSESADTSDPSDTSESSSGSTTGGT